MRCSRTMPTTSSSQTPTKTQVQQRDAADAEGAARCWRRRPPPAACRRRARRTSRSPAWPCIWLRGWSAGTAPAAPCSGSSSRCVLERLRDAARSPSSGTSATHAVARQRDQRHHEQRAAHADVLEQPRDHEHLQQQPEQVDVRLEAGHEPADPARLVHAPPLRGDDARRFALHHAAEHELAQRVDDVEHDHSRPM